MTIATLRKAVRLAIVGALLMSTAACGVSGAVGVSAGAGQPAGVNDQVLVADRPAVEPAFQDLLRPGRVAGLC